MSHLSIQFIQNFWSYSEVPARIANKYAFPDLNLIMLCAGTSSAHAEESMMSKPGKNERRHSATLPVTTAATAQQARNTANAVISSVLQQAVPPRQEAEEKMETGLSGTAAAPMQMSGSGTAGSGSNEPTQEGSGPSRPPAAAKAVYRNYHTQEYGISNLGSGSGNNSGTGNV